MTEPRKALLSTPADILTSIPMITGVQQVTDSIVVVCLHRPAGEGRHQVYCTMRFDLDQCPHGFTHIPEQVESVIVVAYDLHHDHGAVVGLGAWLASTSLRVIESLLVDTAAGTYTSLTCKDPTCCPPNGKPVPTQATFAGADDLAMTGPRVVARTMDDAKQLLDYRAGDVDPLFHGVEGRDAYVAAAVLGDREQTQDAYDALFTACRSLPDDHPDVCDHLAALAIVTYCLGEGMLTNLAMDRVARIDNKHSMTVLLSNLMHKGITPEDLAAIMKEV